MTPGDFYEKLKQVRGTEDLTLSPGPLTVRVNQHDATAAALLLWLYHEMPDDATQGDLIEVLDSARWWAGFWASLAPCHLKLDEGTLDPDQSVNKNGT